MCVCVCVCLCVCCTLGGQKSCLKDNDLDDFYPVHESHPVLVSGICSEVHIQGSFNIKRGSSPASHYMLVIEFLCPIFDP